MDRLFSFEEEKERDDEEKEDGGGGNSSEKNQKTFSKKNQVAAPPFLINYSGALFREWPGPWQVMLKQDSGEYACVAEDRLRYALGEAKAEMAEAMGLDPGKVGAGSAADASGASTAAGVASAVASGAA